MIGLKGLTAQDRQEWEKRFAAQLQGHTPEEIDNAYVNYQYRHKFGDSSMSVADKINSWNNSYDQEQRRQQAKRQQDSINKIQKYGLDTKQIKKAVESGNIMNQSQGQSAYNLQLQDKFKSSLPEMLHSNKVYNETMDRLNKEYDQHYQEGLQVQQDLKDRAMESQPYYQRFHDTDYLDGFDWRQATIEYNAIKDSQGQKAADQALGYRLSNYVGDRQSGLEKGWNALVGMGASAASMGIEGALAFTGVVPVYVIGKQYIQNKQEHPDRGFAVNMLDAILDNPVTQYTNNVFQYQTLDPEMQKEYAKSGIGANPILESANDNALTQLGNFAAEGVQSQGFTLATMLLGAGEAKIAQQLFQGAKMAKLARTAKSIEAGTTESLMSVRNGLQRIQKAQNAFNRFVVPASMGTMEGAEEGLNTKLQFLKDGEERLQQMHNKQVEEDFNQLVNDQFDTIYNTALQKGYYRNSAGVTIKVDNKLHTSDGERPQGNSVLANRNQLAEAIMRDMYQQVSKAHMQDYTAALDKIDEDATKAGIFNFGMNSAINGAVNSTLKATLFSPNVQGSLKASKLYKKFRPNSSKFIVTGEGNNVTVKSKSNIGTKVSNTLGFFKEPAGEFIEEYTQSFTDATARGGAQNDLMSYLQHKYDVDSQDRVNEGFWANLSAAALAGGQEALSKDAFKQGLMGAFGSVLGVPGKARRTIQLNSDGTIKTYDHDVRRFGMLVHKKGDAVKGFGRGRKEGATTKDDREGTNRESWLDVAMRLTPWRSGITQNIKNLRSQRAQLQDEADMLTDWLQKPENRAKYDGMTGTMSWVRQMQLEADRGNEFGFRNSQLGKTVNDMIMLDKLKGTQYADQFLSNLREIAVADPDSKIAKDAIETMKEDPNSRVAFQGKTDQEILEQVKKNANSMLQVLNDVHQASEKLDNLFGYLDDDTKQSLIYGELQIKDWQKRKQQVEDDLGKININNTSNSNISGNDLRQAFRALFQLDDQQRDGIQQHSVLQAQQRSLQSDIDALERRSQTLTKQEQKILKDKRNQLEKTQDKLEKLKPIEKLFSGNVIGERQILQLDPLTRATLLSPSMQQYLNQEQQRVNSNLIAQAQIEDADFQKKIKDAYRIDRSLQKYLNDYNKALLNNQGFNIYRFNVQNAVRRSKYQQKFERLDRIADYNEFSQAMDDLLVNSSKEERDYIIGRFEEQERNPVQSTAQDNTTQQDNIGSVPYRKYIAQKGDNILYAETSEDNGIKVTRPVLIQNNGQEEVHVVDPELTFNDTDYTIQEGQIPKGARVVGYKEIRESQDETVGDVVIQEGDNQTTLTGISLTKNTSSSNTQANQTQQVDSQQVTSSAIQDEPESNFSRYKNNRQKVKDILDNAVGNPYFNTLSDNDINLFSYAVAYLTNRGIDLQNQDAVVGELSAMDDSGNNLFRKYVDSMNLNAEDGLKVNYTSAGEVINSIQRAVQKYDRDQQAQTIISSSVQGTVPEDNTTSQDKPATHKSIFDGKPTTMEENDQALASQLDQTQEGQVQQQQGQQQTQQQIPSDQGTPLDNYKKNGSVEIAKYAERAYKMAGDNKAVRDYLDELSTSDEISTVDEFVQALYRKATQLDTKNGNPEQDKDSQLLSLIAQKISASKKLADAEQARKQADEQQKAQTEEQQRLQKERKDFFEQHKVYGRMGQSLGVAVENANRIQSVDIQYLRQNFSTDPNAGKKYSPLLRYIDEHKVDQFILDNADMFIPGKTKVFFITDSQLEQEQRDVYRSQNIAYDSGKSPLIATVRIKDKTNTSITINNNGTEEYYQPIGLMPRTGARRQSGSNNLGRIRNLASQNEGVDLVRNTDGSLVETVIDAKPRLTMPEDTPQDKGLWDVYLDNMSEGTDKSNITSQDKQHQRNTEQYSDFKSFILPKLRVEYKKDGKRNVATIYIVSENSDPNKRNAHYNVRTPDISEAVGRDTGSTIEQTLQHSNESNAGEVIHFNSRTEHFKYTVDKALGDLKGIKFTPQGELTEDSKKIVNDVNKKLNYKLNDYLFLMEDNAKYEIVPVISNGSISFRLQVTVDDNNNLSNVDNVVLADGLQANDLTPAQSYRMFSNLFMDGGYLRKTNRGKSFVRFQVNYDNVQIQNGQKKFMDRDQKIAVTEVQQRAAKQDISEVLDDGLLQVGHTGISYSVSTVFISNPFDAKGNQRQFKVQTTQQDNASSGSTMTDDQQSKDNGIIDNDSGQGTNQAGQQPAVGDAYRIAQEKAKEIEQDNEWQLDDDGKHYISSKTHQKAARVTSIIQDDVDVVDNSQGQHKAYRFEGDILYKVETFRKQKESEGLQGKELEESVQNYEETLRQESWGRPSTNIGTGMDEFVRDLFGGRMTQDSSHDWFIESEGKKVPVGEIYPNMTVNTANRFAAQVDNFRNSLLDRSKNPWKQKITIIPRDVTVSGQIQATDAQGGQHWINVAGTVDLLGYDTNGDWYLFDMKTVHDQSKVDDPEVLAKWRRQLTLYKEFLESKYKIHIKSINIIPIKVDYPTPKGRKYKGQTGYTSWTVRGEKHPLYNGKENNQLYADGTRFKGATPRLFLQSKGYVYLNDLDPLPLNVDYNAMSDEEKQAELQMLGNIGHELSDQGNTDSPIMGTDSPAEQGASFNPTTNAFEDDSDDSQFFGEDDGLDNDPEFQKFKGQHQEQGYQDSRYEWGVFSGWTNPVQGDNYGKPIKDIKATIQNLQAKGITPESWNNKSSIEKDQELNCAGVF